MRSSANAMPPRTPNPRPTGRRTPATAVPTQSAASAAQSPALDPAATVAQWELDRLMAIPYRRCTCGGWLMRQPAYKVRVTFWLDATCDLCGAEKSMPQGKQTRAPSNHDVVAAGPPAWFRAHVRDHAERAAGD